MTVKTPKPKKHKKLKITLCVILTIIILFSAAIIVFIKVGEAKLKDKLIYKDEGLTTEQAYGDSAEVFYNGQGYIYNDNLINILCIGVDKSNIKDKNDRQADALYLLSLDTESNKFNVVAISRNTLADIDIYDMNNEFLSTEKSQICLSYVYGENDKKSSLLTCKAVSRLMYDIPINAYYTIFMDSIGEIVDAVDGVEIVMPDNMTAINGGWRKGRSVRLNGSNALMFLKYREETNVPRLERQKLFINAFVKSAKSAFKKDMLIPINLFKTISKKSSTNIDASQVSYLATKMANAKFQMNSIKGKSGFDGDYETFEADEDALFKTVLDLFYIKTN